MLLEARIILVISFWKVVHCSLVIHSGTIWMKQQALVTQPGYDSIFISAEAFVNSGFLAEKQFFMPKKILWRWWRVRDSCANWIMTRLGFDSRSWITNSWLDDVNLRSNQHRRNDNVKKQALDFCHNNWKLTLVDILPLVPQKLK